MKAEARGSIKTFNPSSVCIVPFVPLALVLDQKRIGLDLPAGFVTRTRTTKVSKEASNKKEANVAKGEALQPTRKMGMLRCRRKE